MLTFTPGYFQGTAHACKEQWDLALGVTPPLPAGRGPGRGAVWVPGSASEFSEVQEVGPPRATLQPVDLLWDTRHNRSAGPLPGDGHLLTTRRPVNTPPWPRAEPKTSTNEQVQEEKTEEFCMWEWRHVTWRPPLALVSVKRGVGEQGLACLMCAAEIYRGCERYTPHTYMYTCAPQHATQPHVHIHHQSYAPLNSSSFFSVCFCSFFL